MKIREVIRYRVDGREFLTREMAENYARSVNAAAAANAAWSEGVTLGEIAERWPNHNKAGWRPWGIAPVPDSAKGLTKDSLLTISHWQCMDFPNYRIDRIEVKDGGAWEFVVWGVKPGPLGNTYGDRMSLAEIVRYAAK